MNSFGRIFRLTIYGESHGPAVGVVIDGCPAGVPLTAADFEADLSRRRSGGRGTTKRREPDLVHLNSGLYNGFTTGAPIALSFDNTDTRSGDYAAFRDIPRPGHADFTAQEKYGGFNDPRGGGHFSGRLTLGLVAAGVIAKKIIDPLGIEAALIEAGGSREIEARVEEAVAAEDSIGGIIECRAVNVPVGLGEPFFDSVESLIAHLVFAIPAVKGIEFGSGFRAAAMTGKAHNDPLIDASGKTAANHAGGINGGISNGNELCFRVAIKPTSSIGLAQQTVNIKTGAMQSLQIRGRHDACIALRVPVVVEAAAAIVLADLLLLEQGVPRLMGQES
jgi:chorismate synthase